MVRPVHIAILGCVGLGVIGCAISEKSRREPEQIKIGEIGPSGSGAQSGAQLLNAINFSLYIFEIPAENVDKLIDFWSVLDTTALRFNSSSAFKANSFSAGAGQIRMWDKARDLLVRAGGQETGTLALLLPDNQPTDLAVTGLEFQQTISFIWTDLSSQRATIGPGILALRIKAAKIPTLQGACTVIAHPVFTVPMTSPIPELAARAKAREFAFISAAFGLRMSPGDFVVLGPGKPVSSEVERYAGDLTTLGGLFFSNPAGSLFFDPSESARARPPQRKPAVRIFCLLCVRINY